MLSVPRPLFLVKWENLSRVVAVSPYPFLKLIVRQAFYMASNAASNFYFPEVGRKVHKFAEYSPSLDEINFSVKNMYFFKPWNRSFLVLPPPFFIRNSDLLSECQSGRDLRIKGELLI